mmetsp:Transcript_5946/g.4485  ORF Transcript_5946/g.4485 Transcript_5946/m.4485 type:complete len:83 (+) Transcript_5946:298-546(+)
MALGGHMTYHCSSAKKINIGKLDPCLAFTFLLKNYEDFKKFKSFMNIGKQLFQDNWLFSIFELKPVFAHFQREEEGKRLEQD